MVVLPPNHEALLEVVPDYDDQKGFLHGAEIHNLMT